MTLPLAKRGTPFIGTEWSKNNVRMFQLGVMLPNGAGHRILAQTICPKAPETWGCSCDEL